MHITSHLLSTQINLLWGHAYTPDFQLDFAQEIGFMPEILAVFRQSPMPIGILAWQNNHRSSLQEILCAKTDLFQAV